MSLDREALARVVAEKSPLSLTQIERLFGNVDETNKAVVWRFLTRVSPQQQQSIWQVFLRVKNHCPDTQIEAIT